MLLIVPPPQQQAENDDSESVSSILPILFFLSAALRSISDHLLPSGPISQIPRPNQERPSSLLLIASSTRVEHQRSSSLDPFCRRTALSISSYFLNPRSPPQNGDPLARPAPPFPPQVPRQPCADSSGDRRDGPKSFPQDRVRVVLLWVRADADERSGSADCVRSRERKDLRA